MYKVVVNYKGETIEVEMFTQSDRPGLSEYKTYDIGQFNGKQLFYSKIYKRWSIFADFYHYPTVQAAVTGSELMEKISELGAEY